MRSQVQVLAGPPAIVAGQSAVGSGPEALAGRLGRAGAARPSPLARPLALPGPSTRDIRLHDYHPPWLPTQPKTAATRQVRQPRAAACSGALAQPPATGPPHAGLTCLVGQQSSAAAALHPTWPGSAHRHPTDAARLGGLARIQPSLAVDRALQEAAAHRPRPVPVARVAPPHRPGPQRHPLRWEETDASGRTGGGPQTAGRWTAGRWTAGPLDPRTTTTQVIGHRTGWTPDGWTAGSWTANRMGGHACWTRTGDRRHGWHPGHCRARRRRPTAGCRLDAPPDSGRLGEQQPGQLSSKDHQTGLATAATVSCR
jgi:hypothetical protein